MITNNDPDVHMFRLRLAEWLRNTPDLRDSLAKALEEHNPNLMEGITALLAVAVTGANSMRLNEEEFLAMCQILFGSVTAAKENTTENISSGAGGTLN